MAGRPGAIRSDHHADDQLRCAADQRPWPCPGWRYARAWADRNGSRTRTVIDVELWVGQLPPGPGLALASELLT